jgi:ribonuclease VapC
VQSLLDGLGFEIVPVTEGAARRVADAHAQWGKGIHAQFRRLLCL